MYCIIVLLYGVCRVVPRRRIGAHKLGAAVRSLCSLHAAQPTRNRPPDRQAGHSSAEIAASSNVVGRARCPSQPSIVLLIARPLQCGDRSFFKCGAPAARAPLFSTDVLLMQLCGAHQPLPGPRETADQRPLPQRAASAPPPFRRDRPPPPFRRLVCGRSSIGRTGARGPAEAKSILREARPGTLLEASACERACTRATAPCRPSRWRAHGVPA